MARKVRKSDAITPIEYSGLQAAYDHFNKMLFGGKLPDVFITYQRKSRSLGYFSADRFNGRVDKTGRHELALNPDGFIGESDKEICSTLVHEQHHVWQHAAGTAPKRGYHDKEWAAKMKAMVALVARLRCRAWRLASRGFASQPIGRPKAGNQFRRPALYRNRTFGAEWSCC